MRFRSTYSWRVIAVLSILGLIICTILYVELQQAGILPLLPHYTPLSDVGRVAIGVLAILLVFFAGGLYWQFPIVQCESSEISFRRLWKLWVYPWRDVKGVELISHKTSIDTIVVNLADTDISLWASGYDNARELRVFLKNTQPLLTAQKPENDALTSEQRRTNVVSAGYGQGGDKKPEAVFGGGASGMEFSGNVFATGLNFLWILMVGMAGIFGVSNSGNHGRSIRDLLMGGFFIVLWSLFYSFGLHYFVLVDNGIRIRNQIFVWKNIFIPFSEIEDVYFYSAGRSRRALRLVTHDFHVYGYVAASLGEKDWSGLMTALQGRGFTVARCSS